MSASDSSISRNQIALALLRIVIGWHFLYEGWTKVISPGWTSAGYLQSAAGPLAGLFQWMGSNSALLRVIDFFNVWGLVAIGLGLMMGVLVRAAAAGGIALLALYYLAYPPFFTPSANAFTEGQYLIVNKNLVELLALVVVYGYPTAALGLGVLLKRKLARAQAEAGKSEEVPKALDKPLNALLGPMPRRELVATMAGVPFFGAFVLAVLKKHGWKSFEEIQLRSRPAGKPGDVAVASATMKRFQFSTVRELKGQVPHAKIGNLNVSRMILGGNLIGGWAHARDLIYVSKLVRAYHNRGKIFQTFDIAEACGVNTIITNPLLCGIMTDYWRSGGKIQFISDCGGQNILEMVQKSIDNGASACYIQGGVADKLVEDGRFDLIAQALDLIRKNRLPAGIGGHKLSTIQACVDRGLRPDFWMKTLHETNYWSARPGQEENDNIWCDDPVATAAYMRNLPEPWIAFKILAAGALEPKPAFKFAFENGADFICVGMYDFQVVDDVNIFLEVMNGGIKRQREWRA